LFVYLTILPLAYVGMSYNLYRRRRLPHALQVGLDRYTNFFGLILWRVFTIDITHFFVNIYTENPADGTRTPVSHWGYGGGLRYSHVGEAITVASLFTTLKYYPSNPALFHERLLRYARSIPHPQGSILVFELVNIEKTDHDFAFVPIREFEVDLVREAISDRILDERFSFAAPRSGSPIQESAAPGSYVPLNRRTPTQREHSVGKS
jgi:hypothetical protein